ncbi:MAG: hypothetical protein GY931_15545 [Maribacter sp.]|nr:hypothetical protein [Maribacter sp.]
MLSNYIPFVLIPFIGWGVTRFLKKNSNYTPLKKVTLYIGLTAFFITEMVRSFYRPYVQKNDVFDYYFSDTIGNSFGTITAIFMVLTLSGKGSKNDWKIIVILILGLICYEFLNLASRFDYRDVIATIIFGTFSSLLYFYLIMKYSQRGNRTNINN